MPSSYASLHYHIIFSTKERRAMIDTPLQGRLYDYIGGIAIKEGAMLRAIGGVADHVHLLASVPPTLGIADFLRLIKTNSSKWVHDNFAAKPFGWQDQHAWGRYGRWMLDNGLLTKAPLPSSLTNEYLPGVGLEQDEGPS